MKPVRSVVVFGDEIGLPRLLGLLAAPGVVKAAVRAAVRPGAAADAERAAARAGVPLLVQPPTTDASWLSFLEAVRAAGPDLLLVDSYAMRLPAELLATAAHGGVNVHGALLPRHRGANPVQWALIDDDRETGVTIHRMTERFDEGEILAQARVPIGFSDTWVEIFGRQGSASEELLAGALPRILAGDLSGTPQNEEQATYRPRRRPEDGLIDWTARSLDIYNLIRALVAPNPGAFYERDGNRVVLDRFMPIWEVAALKYTVSGEESPVGTPRADGGDVILGDARLVDVDWDGRTARLEGPAEPARSFADREFGLDVRV